ncbi:ubiquitin carboxyl-terminal hydrolase 1 [Podospora aff. communis PSN243]|uniref:ubiquitinyl hydrolase 1 n=1 Tax=Podospora aff. communis PSN243 TaxID=3040156 RepID=A0AAV9GYY2_9PEZI|nr:ubiquitin carboxyl-terminal hydrolase 1 [Podospora aff. communis PSN243]
MMNSDARRALSHYDTYHFPGPHQSYYSLHGLTDRLSNPATFVPIFVLALTIVYQVLLQQGRLPALRQLVWDWLVYAIPASLLFAVERWLDPPLFPIPMLQVQSRSHAAKSDALRRILRLDKPGGFMMSVSQAGRRGLNGLSSVALGDKAVVDQPAGLGNYNNSCYQNSILQSLAALNTFPEYLSNISTPADNRPVTQTADALRSLIHDLNDPANHGRTLWPPSVLKNMSTWQQQDAQEYFSKLLDEIDKEIIKSTKRLRRPPSFEVESPNDDTSASQHSDDSGYQSLSSLSKSSIEPRVNRNPLEGLVAQRVACVACGYCTGLSMIPFNCLTLNLGINRPEHDLYERLDNYTKVEPITGVECPKCSLLKYQNLVKTILEKSPEVYPELRERLVAIEEALEEETFDDKTLEEKCNILPQKRVTSTKTKQVVVARPPQSLAIHVNRSVFDENTGRMFKNSAAVRFPRTLDLGPWCLGSANQSTMAQTGDKNGGTGAQDEEQWLVEPLSSMVAGDRRPSKITGPIYELRAVVTHYGQHENGHYVCYRRHRKPQQAAKDIEDEERAPLLVAEEHEHQNVPQPDEVESIVDEAEIGDRTVDDKSSDDWVDVVSEDDYSWYRLSDHDVTQEDEATVLGQGGVFMLFYDCVDPNSVLVSDIDDFVDAQSGPEPSEGQYDQVQQLPTPPGTDASEDEALERAGVPESAMAQGQSLHAPMSVPLPDEGDEL